ncbi:Non-histone chromosomal protein [Lachnellula suecica]|uniref:Non-histone chromosomal protein n=1 Tax=Lachnellula suecica TaxID=602035 RepID=A0A8T9C8Q4_9HELO|nr:Non-histone chromosomal protein [Lachnellula suecica]
MLSSIGRAALRRGGAGAGFASTKRAAQNLWTLQRVNLANEPTIKSHAAFAFLRFQAPAKKPAKKKKKPVKPKAKKPKKPVKKVLTDTQKEKIKLKVLKEKALVPPQPEGPVTAWMVLVSENLKEAGNGGGQAQLGDTMKALAAKYRALSPEEREAFNHKASQNKLSHEVAIKKWAATHTPEEINAANNARNQLRKLTKHNWTPIPDTRIPKRPTTPYIFFFKERRSSGDFKGIAVGAATKVIATEWKALSAGERKVYEDQFEADKFRYAQEFKTVYHRDSSSTLKSAA